MPPTSTPATVTPSAIRSSRELSYANAATAPPMRTRRTTATRMNHRCRIREEYPVQGIWRPSGRHRLTAGLRGLDSRTAPRQHGFDGAQHPRPVGVIALVVAQRLEVLVLQRREQRDDLLGGEVVVTVHRGPRRSPLGLLAFARRGGLLRPLRLGGAGRQVVRKLRLGGVRE